MDTCLKKADPDPDLDEVAREMWTRRVVERVLLLAERRRFPHDPDLPLEPVLWARLARQVLAADGDLATTEESIRSEIRRLAQDDLPHGLDTQVRQFIEGLVE